MTTGRPRNHIIELRRALADYMYSEGCDCCRNSDDHADAKARLGKILRIAKYKDGSGYDFYKYRTKKEHP